MRKKALIAMLGLASAGLFPMSADATVTLTANGVSSAGVPVSLQADLKITGNMLVIKLFNNSPVHSQNPNDLLSSFYFDIVNGLNVRPTLTYQSATGDVWLTSSSATDSLQISNANLKAVAVGDNTWQFKAMDATASPNLGFGIGTVGNSNLTPNNFMGSIVGGFDYSIYSGDVTTSNLDNRLLVKNMATFKFSGLSGFSESDISAQFGFGLGTAPDSLLRPEPASIALLGLTAILFLRRRP